MRNLKAVLSALALFNLAFAGQQPAMAKAKLPTTEQFQSLLTICAAGINIEIDGEIRGSFSSVYEEASTDAKKFKLLTETDFLNSLPPEDRLAGYKLYQECVIRILRGELGLEEAAQGNGRPVDLGAIGNRYNIFEGTFYVGDKPHEFIFRRNESCWTYIFLRGDKSGYVSVYEEGRDTPLYADMKFFRLEKYKKLNSGSYRATVSFNVTTSYRFGLKNRKC